MLAAQYARFIHIKMIVAISPSSFAQKNPKPMEALEASGVEIRPNPYSRRLTEEEAIEHLQGVSGLIAGLEPLTRRVLESATALKTIARVGIGMDNIDHDAAAELGITISNTPTGPTNAVAEMAVAAMLTLGRNIIPANAALHEKEWKKMIGTGISGAEVLVVGYGRIGRKVGELVHALGGSVLVCDPYCDGKTLSNGEHLVDLATGLAGADFVTLHASGRDVIIGADQLSAMKSTAYLINSARGELVDEQALVRALDNHELAGAWFDVFWTEPYTGPLTEYPQVLLTPHTGTYTGACRLDMELSAVENCLRDLGVTT